MTKTGPPRFRPRKGRLPNEYGISVTVSSRFHSVATFCGGLFGVSLTQNYAHKFSLANLQYNRFTTRQYQVAITHLFSI